MNLTALLSATESMKKREGDLLPTLKTIFFEELKVKYKKKIINDILVEHKGGSWGRDYFEGGIRVKVLRSPDIRFGFIDFDNAEERYFTKKEIASFSLKNNDILVIKSNGSLDLVGKSQIYKENKKYPSVIASNFLLVLSPNEEVISPEYLDLFLKSPESLVWRFDAQKTTTGLRNLNSKGYFNIEIPVPDTIEEQNKLFNDFNRFTQGDIKKEEMVIRKFYSLSLKKELLNNQNTYQLDLLKKFRQQVLRDAVQGKLVPQDPNDEPASAFLERIKAEKEKLVREKKIKEEKSLSPIQPEEIPFEIPESWVWCKLGEIAYIASGSTPNQDAFVSKGIPYLKMYNLRNQKIDFDYKPQYIKEDIHNGQLKRSQTQVGDVIMNIVGPPLGKLAIIPESLPQANFNQAGVLIRPFLFKEINGWIFWYLNELSEINSIATKGVAGQDNISVTQSKNLKVALPPLSEQCRLVNKIKNLMKLCDELEQTISQNQKYTKDILQIALKEALEPKNNSAN